MGAADHLGLTVAEVELDLCGVLLSPGDRLQDPLTTCPFRRAGLICTHAQTITAVKLRTRSGRRWPLSVGARPASHRRSPVLPTLRFVAWRIAVANQKGGVGKTTTVHSLGYALVQRGRRVLLVDLDPQACLTYSVGIDPGALEVSLYDVLVRRTAPLLACREVPDVPGLSILPATVDLAAAEIHLLTRPGREYILGHALAEFDASHDVVLIDCPPSLGVLTINALTAANEALIPFQCETLSTRGVHQLLEMIEDIRIFTNAGLQVRGAVATMFDRHTLHSREMLDVVGNEGLQVLSPPVRKSIRFAEAPARSRCILQHAPRSPGADAYRALALQLDLALPQLSADGSAVTRDASAPEVRWQAEPIAASS